MNIVEDLPKSPPLGDPFDWVRLAFGVALCLLAVAYLLWKLPRKGGRDGEGDDGRPPEG